MTSPIEDVRGMVERLTKRADSYLAMGRPETTIYADYGPSDEKLDRDILAVLGSLAEENERLRKERDVYIGIAGAAFSGTDHARRLADGCQGEYDSYDKAYRIWRKDWDEAIDVNIAPLRQRAESAESRLAAALAQQSAERKAVLEFPEEPSEEMIAAAMPAAFIGHPEASEESKARWFKSHRLSLIEKYKAMRAALIRALADQQEGGK